MTRMTEQQLNAYASANGMTPVQAALHILQQPTPLANHPDFSQYKTANNVIIAQLRGRVYELEKKLRQEYEKDRSLKQRADHLVNSVEKMLDEMAKNSEVGDSRLRVIIGHGRRAGKSTPSFLDVAECILEDLNKRETF